MPSPILPEKKVRTIQINRFQIGVNVLIQILLGLVIFGMVNYLAFNRFKRWDFSRDRTAQISDQTRRVIGQLEDKMRMTVLVPESVPVFQDIQNLITEYQTEAKRSKKKIDVETLNPYRNLQRAKELQQKYKFGAQEALIILEYQGRTKFLNVVDMVVMSAQEDLQVAPEMKAFRGEQVLTQGMLEVMEPGQNKVYFVGGLGGPDVVAGPEHKTIVTYLARQNHSAVPLNLLNVDAVPADAKAVFLVAPKYDLTERALSLLQDYWSRKGRLFIALDPGSETPRLTNWLGALGVKPRNDRVKKTENLGGGMMGVYKQIVADFQPGHPITKNLAGAQTIFDGQVQTLEVAGAGQSAIPSPVMVLIRAAEGFWGETSYNAPEDQPIRFDPGIDHAAPLVLAAAVEQGAVPDQRVKVETSRLVCVANGDFLSDAQMNKPNLDFTLASANWLSSREQLISIAPKEKASVRMGLDQQQISQISWMVLIVIPGLIALWGAGVTWSRRR